MRVVAALLVFLFHVHAPQLERLTGQGRVGVSFFFVLSGLLLGLSYRTKTPATTFYRRRLARIYPAYFVSLIAGLGVSLWLGDSLGRSYGGPLAFFLLQSWVPDGSIYYVWNPVSWSLSAEVFFYLLFPLLAKLVVGASVRTTWIIRVVCVALLLALGLWASSISPNAFDQPDSFTTWATYIAPICRLPEFVLGMSLVSAVRGQAVLMPKWAVAALLAVAYFLAGFDPTGLGIAAITIIPICLFLVRFAQADSAGDSSILHNKWLVLAGEASYCFYLVHQIVIRSVGHLIPNHLFPGSILVFSLLLAAAFALALHKLVEVPLDRHFNGRSASVLNRGFIGH